MLSQHDRRALAAIEAHTRDSDPAFVRRMERAFGRRAAARGGRVRLRVCLGLAVLGLLLLATAFAVRSADAAVSGVVVLLVVVGGVVVGAVTRLRRRRASRAG